MSEQITQHVILSNQDVVSIPEYDTNDGEVPTVDYATLYPSILIANKNEIIARVAESSPEKATELEQKINSLEKKRENVKETISYGHFGIPSFSSVYKDASVTTTTAVGRETLREFKEQLKNRSNEAIYGDIGASNSVIEARGLNSHTIKDVLMQ